jgi:hypothetical protein
MTISLVTKGKIARRNELEQNYVDRRILNLRLNIKDTRKYKLNLKVVKN